MSRKIYLQSHRLKSFYSTLDHVEGYLQRRIMFIESFAEVYNFPVSVTRRNLRQYRKQLKAVQALKDFKT